MMNNEKYIVSFLDYLSSQRNFSNHTIRNYRIDLYAFIKYLDCVDSSLTIIDIDRTFIQDFIKELSLDGKSDKTIQRKVASIKSFYKYLSFTNQVRYNITELIGSPKVAKKLPYLLTLKEVDLLMEQPDLTTHRGLRDKSILEIFYSTGVRISEIISIKINDLLIDKRMIKILGKGSKERYVILGKEALNSIGDYLRIRHKTLNSSIENLYLYPSLIKNSNKHISYKTMYNIVKKYLGKVSNNEKLSPHSLRHSFATHLLESGADIMSVKDLLGHKDLSSTQIYTNLNIKKIKAIYKLAHPDAK